MGLGRSFSIPSYAGARCGSITPVTSIAGLQQVTSSGWHQSASFSPLTPQVTDTLSTEQAAEVYQLTTECWALGSELAKQFQTISGLEAMLHATAHETVLSGCVACSTTYRITTTIQNAVEGKSTLHGLCIEANKAWKNVNDVILSYLLRYDSQLEGFITSPEDILWDKHEEIWRHIHSLAETANLSPQTSLTLALQTLDWLPTIPLDLSYHVGVPMMFTYGPELYELQSWSATGDANYLLDSHAQVTNLLSRKLVHMCDGVGPDDPSPSRAASPTGSTVPNSLAHSPTRSHSCSRTPSCKTKMERSRSSSVSSTHSQEDKPKSLAESGGKDSNNSDSTSQEDNKTDDEGEANSDGKAFRDGEGSDGRSSDSEDSNDGGEIADHDGGAEESNSKAKGSNAESSSSSSKTDGEIPTRVAPLVKETKQGILTKEAKGGNPNFSQMLSLPDLD